MNITRCEYSGIRIVQLTISPNLVSKLKVIHLCFFFIFCLNKKFTGPVVSALANKFGCRAVCIAGSVISCAAFVLSTFSTSIGTLMITYGIIGGFGFGLIYLPAVVAVGYYFETKRSLATGIAVCGSGMKWLSPSTTQIRQMNK